MAALPLFMLLCLPATVRAAVGFTIDSSTLTYVGGTGTQAIDAAATVQGDDFTNATLRVAIASGVVVTEDILQVLTRSPTLIANNGSISVNLGTSVPIGAYVGGTAGTDLVITLNGVVTPNHVRELLRSIAYFNLAGATPTDADRSVALTMTKTSVTTVTQTRVIDVGIGLAQGLWQIERADCHRYAPFLPPSPEARVIQVAVGYPDLLERQAVGLQGAKQAGDLAARIDDRRLHRLRTPDDGAVLRQGGDRGDDRADGGSLLGHVPNIGAQPPYEKARDMIPGLSVVVLPATSGQASAAPSPAAHLATARAPRRCPWPCGCCGSRRGNRPPGRSPPRSGTSPSSRARG